MRPRYDPKISRIQVRGTNPSEDTMCDFTLKPETLYFPETSAITYQTSRCRSPKDGSTILCRRMSLTYLVFILYPDRVKGISVPLQARGAQRVPES